MVTELRQSGRHILLLLAAAGLILLQACAAPKGTTAPKKIADRPLIAGPHLDGDAYAGLRGLDEADIVVTDVTVSSSASNTKFKIVVGPDYVLEDRPLSRALYDFRYRRFLEIDLNSREFTNTSLYGMFHTRWAFLQNNLITEALAGQHGSDKQPALSRYWIEGALGIAYPGAIAFESMTQPSLAIQREGGSLTAVAENTTVATANFNGQSFPTAAHAKSFAAWLVWSMRIHPRLASMIAGEGAVPLALTLYRREPYMDFVGGVLETTTLQLEGVSRSRGRLDATLGLVSKPPAWPPYIPEAIATLMVNAALGSAAGGPIDDAVYADVIRALLGSGKRLDAVLVAVRASYPYDGCSDRQLSPDLCDAASQAWKAAWEDSTGILFADALALGQNGDHTAAAKALIALRGKASNNGDILEVMIANELVEAKRSSKVDPELSNEYARLQHTFTAAIVESPYNAAIYRDFYNYLLVATADSNIDDSYIAPTKAQAVMDLARSLPVRRIPKIVTYATTVENSVADDFRDMFPTY